MWSDAKTLELTIDYTTDKRRHADDSNSCRGGEGHFFLLLYNFHSSETDVKTSFERSSSSRVSRENNELLIAFPRPFTLQFHHFELPFIIFLRRRLLLLSLLLLHSFLLPPHLSPPTFTRYCLFIFLWMACSLLLWLFLWRRT